MKRIGTFPNVNVKSMYFMCKAILPMMVKQNSGSIINVSSCASRCKSFQIDLFMEQQREQ